MTAPRPMAEYDLADRMSYQAPPLEADLIMKGGITSGVVYPLVAGPAGDPLPLPSGTSPRVRWTP